MLIPTWLDRVRQVCSVYATIIPLVGVYHHSQCHLEYEWCYEFSPGRSRAAGPLGPQNPLHLISQAHALNRFSSFLKITCITHDRSSDTNPACPVRRF
jgi:hypothetical protein